MKEIKENIGVKREMSRFMNRFFYNKEKSLENLAKMYYYLDDFQNYVSKMQETIGNELLANDKFDKVILKDEQVKVFLDDELHTILIDALSAKDKKMIEKEENEAFIKELHEKAKK